jgi:predicted N-acetyltransferase YhbS
VTALDLEQDGAMSLPLVVEFDGEHVAGAAAVLERRHRRHRAATAHLPEVSSYVDQVTAAFEKASGAVALDGDEVVGYLLGVAEVDDIGPHTWSHLAGHAVDDPFLVQDLYALAAARWVDEGARRHFVFVPALDELVAPWFRLSFGASAATAARSSSGIPDWSAPSVEVRRVEPRDFPQVARLERLLFTGLLESPSFSGRKVDTVQEFEDEWRRMDGNDKYVSFLAELDGEVVGQLFLYRRPEGDLRVPTRSIDLASATTTTTSRRRGVATALTWTAIAWAREHGIDTIITDWRMTNLVASRFWPARGFTETYLRLYRAIP